MRNLSLLSLSPRQRSRSSPFSFRLELTFPLRMRFLPILQSTLLSSPEQPRSLLMSRWLHLGRPLTAVRRLRKLKQRVRRASERKKKKLESLKRRKKKLVSRSSVSLKKLELNKKKKKPEKKPERKPEKKRRERLKRRERRPTLRRENEHRLPRQ